MKWEEIGDQPCSVARTLSVLGDRWTMLILRNAFMGVRRFDDFQRSLGWTRHVLSERLKRLVEHEILVKVPYVQRQERFEYQLTEKGLDLYPIILAMVQWADKWMDLGMGKPLEFTHKSCGKKINPKVVCSECNDQIHVQDVRVAAGP
ncbi:MAG TPA: transcriptional regulator, partial [Acinetobacter sp.]|nr:transcriptional regulator [Acinetobacter sp.]